VKSIPRYKPICASGKELAKPINGQTKVEFHSSPTFFPSKLVIALQILFCDVAPSLPPSINQTKWLSPLLLPLMKY